MNTKDYKIASKTLRSFSEWAFIERCKGDGLIYFKGKECFIDPNEVIKRMNYSMMRSLDKHPVTIAPPLPEGYTLNFFTKEFSSLRPEAQGCQPCTVTITYNGETLKQF